MVQDQVDRLIIPRHRETLDLVKPSPGEPS
jgi:hypothetical protein